MGDAVATNVLIDDETFYVAKFTNISDGTGESGIAKVDVSALTHACYLVSIDEITWACNGMGVQILWDATTDVLVWVCPEDTAGHIDFKKSAGGPLINTKATGYTGDILFTTQGHSSGDTYSIILKCTKTVG